ncbi:MULTISPECIES: nicotinamide-nucleotide amidohydrolase family protein [unclassified Arthrobacter]|uniref:CinA family protein n=1 Tax=unclassified Arthrobacter TaxID=235627 RepID=UPI001E3A3CA7|nr:MULTISPECIES: nicotinamide-nucleotide amidohydrolase family protein [unclassified Arthrobacter]MCC9146291.1 nicotinamide-nucleotide amidohydrolase family protein [Arthrobacter sp. zg-Y919]MDK1277521.1 nicotinamide-nucleotide amidohydrolase family protein [Arthrobacter sp. zg.Y919]WIB04006.1 nicotinamide-nucleotide amidohydrolase family protein [Arthrobacter sp. zg-Y919]
MNLPPDAVPAGEVLAAARRAGLTVATAESLTAGMLCAELGSVPGASSVLQGGVVAYQNSVKLSVLGVPAELLAEAGSVDGRVAGHMAAGARRVLGADVGVSTTGAAGPEAHDGKPVGTVFVGIATSEGTSFREFHFSGDRTAIRTAACEAALSLLATALDR